MHIMVRSFFVLIAACFLHACGALPNDGPLSRNIVSEGSASGNGLFGIVDLNPTSVQTLDDHNYFPLRATFGRGGPAPGNRIGPGDILNVTIFEAGPDGLFSTEANKSTNLDVTVQNNGRISIPFVGTVKAGGYNIEQVRGAILRGLKGRAVEPDVVVNVRANNSRGMIVNGAVRLAGAVPLSSGKERVLNAVALAGGPTEVPHETFISLTRGNKTKTVLLQTLIDRPEENIFVRPGDSLFLNHDPLSFSAFGAVSNRNKILFESSSLNLIEAAALAGGLDSERADPGGYFVFRYENEHVVRHLLERFELEDESVQRVLDNKDARDDEGRIPIVYKIDLSDPGNFFVAQRFPMRNKDVIYVARHVSSDFITFLRLINQSAGVGRNVTNF